MNSTQSKLVFGLLVCLLAAPLAATNSQPATLGETINVRVVNVEAVVTDRNGVRVPGLTASDFRLVVDGREVPIEYFSEILGGDVVDREQDQQTAGGLVPGEPLGSSYLVFIDEFFTVAADRRRVLRSLVHELGFLGPSDRMAIVAWDGQHVEMLSSWSQSPRDLTAVLQAAIARPSGGLRRLAELRSFEFDRGYLRPRRSLAGFDSQRLSVEERLYMSLLTSQLEGAVVAASSTLRGFAQPPGRKVMLMLAGSWPEHPAQYVVGDLQRLIVEYMSEGGQQLYGQLTDTANLLGYTLYPVDVAGLEGQSVVDASYSRTGFLSRNRQRERELQVHYGLEHIAAKTGGVALLNGQGNRPLENVYADTRSFYWIGFTPQRIGDDSRHDIRLEVANGWKLRSRNGFVDYSTSSEVSMAVESALLFGNPSIGQEIDVRLGPARRAGFGKVEVPLTITLPMAALTLLDNGDEWVGQLELRVAVMDENGNRADIPVIPIEIRRSEAPVADDNFSYQTTLKMRSRNHEMVVALYDGTSGEIFASGATFIR